MPFARRWAVRGEELRPARSIPLPGVCEPAKEAVVSPEEHDALSRLVIGLGMGLAWVGAVRGYVFLPYHLCRAAAASSDNSRHDHATANGVRVGLVLRRSARSEILSTGPPVSGPGARRIVSIPLVAGPRSSVSCGIAHGSAYRFTCNAKLLVAQSAVKPGSMVKNCQ